MALLRAILITFFLSVSFIGTASAQEKLTLNILFIGNSYTFHHNIPGMLDILINENPNSPVKVHIETSTAPSLSLKEQWERGEPIQKIKSRNDWNFIVLQNQSTWASHNTLLKQAREYAPKFAQIGMEHGGVILIPETWPKQKQSDYYTRAPWLKSYSDMYIRNEEYSHEIAKLVSGEVVRIAPYWVATEGTLKNLKLYEDGSHASLAGAYLNALVYYKYFTGTAFENPNIGIKGINKDTAHALQHIVKTLTPKYRNELLKKRKQ